MEQYQATAQFAKVSKSYLTRVHQEVRLLSLDGLLHKNRYKRNTRSGNDSRCLFEDWTTTGSFLNPQNTPRVYGDSLCLYTHCYITNSIRDSECPSMLCCWESVQAVRMIDTTRPVFLPCNDKEVTCGFYACAELSSSHGRPKKRETKEGVLVTSNVPCRFRICPLMKE